jgi:hypothetical protein
MSRGAHTFKQGDVTKALKGAEKAGLKVQRAEVRQDGSILLDFDPPTKTPDDRNVKNEAAPQSPLRARVRDPARHDCLLSPQAGTLQG